MDKQTLTRPVSDHITDLMLALPSRELIAAATDEQLESYRRISNLLDNMVFLECERRQRAAEAKSE